MLAELAMGVSGSAAYDDVRTAAVVAFRYVARTRPDLNEQAGAAIASGDPQRIEQVFRHAVEVINAAADDGSLMIAGAVLSALDRVRFEHGHGSVAITDRAVSSAELV